MVKSVAIQGVNGCFHEQAARSYFSKERIAIVECLTFPELFTTLEQHVDMLGIVAIENTIAGSLLQNYELLRGSGLTIIGEQKLRIEHVVAALDGDSLDSLKEINSHPIALMQCAKWLSEHPHLKAVERDDTAGSACEIAQGNLRGHAAICSDFAAQMYGLKILERGVETNKHNYTRFLIVAPRDMAASMVAREELNKASLLFSLSHDKGSLSKVLTILSFYDINLSKIQSVPIIGREWEYLFYVDITYDDHTRYRQSIEAIRPLTIDLQILGEYAESPTPGL